MRKERKENVERTTVGEVKKREKKRERSHVEDH